MAKKRKKNKKTNQAAPELKGSELPKNQESWSLFSEILESPESRKKFLAEGLAQGQANPDPEGKILWAGKQLLQNLSLGESFEEPLALLKNLAEESAHPQAIEWISWVALFDSGVQADLGLVEGALASRPENSSLLRLLALHHYLNGDREAALASLVRLNQSDSSESWDSEAKQALDKNEVLPLGSGVLVPSLDFGSLHHLKEPKQNYRIHFSVLRGALHNFPENEHLLFETALHGFFLSEWEICKDLLGKILTLNPNQQDAQAMLGFVLEKLGDLSGAKQKYLKVLSVDPEHPLANVNLGILYSREGNLIRCEHHLAKALDTAPEFPEALSQYARYCVHNELNADRILDMHRKALLFEPEESEYHLHYCLSLLRLGDIDKLQSEWNHHKKYIQAFTKNEGARRLISRVLSGNKEPLQDVGVAEMLIENGFPRPARIFLNRAWRRKYNVPENQMREFLYHVGTKASSCEEHHISKEAFELLQQKDPGFGAVAIYIAMAHARMGEAQEALRCLENYQDDTGKLGVMKANLFWELGQPDKAFVSLEEELNSNGPGFLALYYGVKYALAENQIETAQKYLDNSRSTWGKVSGFSALQGEVYLTQGESGKALSHLKEDLYREGLPVAPEESASPGLENNKADAFYILGCALLKSGNFGELTELLPWLETHFPGQGEWEVLDAESGLLQEGAEAALAKISSSNRTLPAYVSKANILKTLGREDEARKAEIRAAEIYAKGRMYYHPQGNLKELLEQPAAV